MNKKQLGAFLKVVSKDTTRPILTCAYVDEYNGKAVLVGTDSYKLTAVYIDGEVDEEIKGKMIRRESLERWYKLATGKSRLTADELKQVSSEDYTMNGDYMYGTYPKWQPLVAELKNEPQSSMKFNAEFFKIVQDLNKAEHIEVVFNGILSPMVIDTEVAYSVVMPIKQ